MCGSTEDQVLQFRPGCGCLRADAQIRDAAQKSFQADCARERDVLTQKHGAERERAVDAEKREKRLQRDLAKLSRDHARSQSAHKGARHALNGRGR